MASSPVEFRYSSEPASAAANEIRTSSLASSGCLPSTMSPPAGRSWVRKCLGSSGWFGTTPAVSAASSSPSLFTMAVGG